MVEPVANLGESKASEPPNNGSWDTVLPNEDGFAAIAIQEGNRGTQITNNGLDKILSRVQQVDMRTSQKGDDNFQNTNNAEMGDYEKQLLAHNARIAGLQKLKGENVRVMEVPARLKARGHPMKKTK